MRAIWRKCGAALVLLVAGLLSGCDLATLSYFLMPESKVPPEMKQLASSKKEVKALILTYSDLQGGLELIQADSQLSEILYKSLKQRFEENREKVTLVQPRRVEDFKNEHPSWKSDMDPVAIGRKFGVDYVIYIEVGSMSLYKKDSYNTILQGRINGLVSVIDVNNHDEPQEKKDFSCVYPNEAQGGKAVDSDTQVGPFRTEFLEQVAKRLTWYFTAHSPREKYHMPLGMADENGGQ
jgi:hypothetical protein